MFSSFLLFALFCELFLALFLSVLFVHFFALSCKKKIVFFFSEAKKEKGNKGQKKGSLMQKSKIDVTKILIVPFFWEQK